MPRISVTPPTQKRLRELFRYIPETGTFIRLLTTSPRSPAGTIAGSFNSLGYRRIGVDGKQYLAHRLAWLYMYNEWPYEIDHINGDPSDNRLCNLRSVTHLENMKNCKINKLNSSGYSGVYLRGGKYVVAIEANKQRVYGGVFESLPDALEKRKELYSRFSFDERHGIN